MDWGIQMAGMISVPLYPTASLEKTEEALEIVPVDLLVLGKLDEEEKYAPLLEHSVPSLSLSQSGLTAQYSWSDIEQHSPISKQQYHLPESAEIMTILFTSGTSGRAKGVELSYGAYHYSCSNAVVATEVGTEDRMLSYLPVAHIAERMMIQGVSVYTGAKIYFVESLDSFVRDLRRAQPTAFMSVPRLWKKFHSEIEQRMPTPVLNVLLAIPGLNNVIRKKLRKALGLEFARLTGSGAAAMPKPLLKWYRKLDIPISEAWGMSETCGLSTMNFPYQIGAEGHIGQAVPGAEIKLSDDGELLIRSPGLFSGYFNDPETTKQAFDDEGFFRTGDKGVWHEATNSWQLTGRLKESFKTEKGKYIAPASIENKLVSHQLIEQACVMGEGHDQPAAVIQLSDVAQTQPKQKLESLLTEVLNQVNKELDRHERLKNLLVAVEPWSTEDGSLTPTMKIRRMVLENRYLEKLKQHSMSPVRWG
jgi:long-subunit acyl-CoA synthetase (AMP-forming)